VRYLFSDGRGVAVADRIDRRVDALPGQSGLHLLRGALSKSTEPMCRATDTSSVSDSKRLSSLDHPIGL
jgi:hypothetical protein